MVAPMVAAAGISALGNIAGGLFGASAASKQQAMQLKFAKNAIQWKTADALKAGVHPAFALGAPTISYNPVATGDLGQGLAAAGQDIGRAVMAQAPADVKAGVYAKSMQALELERGSLQNQVLREQLRQMQAAGTPPAYPGGASVIPGAGNGRVYNAFGQNVAADPRESQAQKLEDEWGEISDIVGGARFLRDTDSISRKYVLDSLKAIISGSGPGVIAPDFGFGRTRNYSRPNPAVRR